MKPSKQKFVVHEGLTELEQMKLEMFRTVVRNGVRVLLVACSVILGATLLGALLAACGYRF
jgi:hypothetical protein